MTMPDKRSHRHGKNSSERNHEFPDRRYTAECDTSIYLRINKEHKNQIKENHDKGRNTKFHGANISGLVVIRK